MTIKSKQAVERRFAMAKNPVYERLIHVVLERQTEKYGNRTFFYSGEKQFGFEDFNLISSQVACGMQDIGVEKGDKVAIILPNCPEYPFLWFGLSRLGAVEVPLNTAHKGEILKYMLTQSDARILVMDSQYSDRVQPVLGDVPGVETVIALDTTRKGALDLDKPVIAWDKIVDNNGRYKPVDVKWSDPYGIMFTSGTTGPSKGALMPQNYALFMGEICIEAVEYNEDDCLYNALPFFHGNAQVLSFMPALMSGARTVLAERFSAGRFWEEVRRYKCTEFNYIGGIVPILYKADPKPDDADNPLKKMLGAAAPKDLFEAFEKRFGVKLVEAYGMNEIGMPLMTNLRDRKPGSCGKPLADLGQSEAGEQIEIETTVYRRVVRRRRYRATCQCTDQQRTVTAPLPAKLLSKSSYGTSLWIHLLLEKLIIHFITTFGKELLAVAHPESAFDFEAFTVRIAFQYQ